MSPFLDRHPSTEARQAMEVIMKSSPLESRQIIEECRESLSKTTNHDHVGITRGGGDAIYKVLKTISGSILLPDQGTWKGTLKQCEDLNLQVNSLKTDLGVIIPEELKSEIELHKPTALLITSFAGYIAGQDVKTISKICRAHAVLLIEDASMAIGDRVLADGRYSDIIVGSARKPKLLNLDVGGFVTANDEDLISGVRDLNEEGAVACAGILKELGQAQQNLDNMVALSEKLKKRLTNPIHKNERAPCVGVLNDNPKKILKDSFTNDIKTTAGKSLFTKCPRTDRFLRKGLVVEFKKIEPSNVLVQDIEALVDLLENSTF